MPQHCYLAECATYVERLIAGSTLLHVAVILHQYFTNCTRTFMQFKKSRVDWALILPQKFPAE